VLCLYLASALAQPPPLSTWTASDREAITDEDGDFGRVVGPPTHADAIPFATPLDPIPQPHVWADDDELTVALSGDLGKLYYLELSVRGGPLVARWQQGPYAGEDQTTWLAIDTPEDLLSPLRLQGGANLSVRVHSTTFQGEHVATTGLDPTVVVAGSGRMERSTSAIPDQTVDAVIDPALLDVLRAEARAALAEKAEVNP